MPYMSQSNQTSTTVNGEEPPNAQEVPTQKTRIDGRLKEPNFVNITNPHCLGT